MVDIRWSERFYAALAASLSNNAEALDHWRRTDAVLIGLDLGTDYEQITRPGYLHERSEVRRLFWQSETHGHDVLLYVTREDDTIFVLFIETPQ